MQNLHSDKREIVNKAGCCLECHSLYNFNVFFDQVGGILQENTLCACH